MPGTTGVELDLERYDRLWAGVEEKIAADDAVETADWYCLQVAPWRCAGCGARFRHVAAAGESGEHLIVVWPTKDDPNMYAEIGALNGKAAIVAYEQSLGPAISYYELEPS